VVLEAGQASGDQKLRELSLTVLARLGHAAGQLQAEIGDWLALPELRYIDHRHFYIIWFGFLCQLTVSGCCKQGYGIGLPCPSSGTLITDIVYNLVWFASSETGCRSAASRDTGLACPARAQVLYINHRHFWFCFYSSAGLCGQLQTEIRGWLALPELRYIDHRMFDYLVWFASSTDRLGSGAS
jgi:hypothetical protein